MYKPDTVSPPLEGEQTTEHELFECARKELGVEFCAADEKERPRILTARYQDSIALDGGDMQLFEKRFMIPLPERTYFFEMQRAAQFETSRASAGAVRSLSPQEENSTPHPVRYDYGPSVIYSVPPGEFLFVPTLGEQDVIGSSAFSVCTALIIKNEVGIFYAHITTRMQGIRRALDDLNHRGLTGKKYLVCPEYISKSDSTDEKETARSYNDYARIADNYDIAIARYPIPPGALPPGVFEHSILATRDGIISVGYDIAPEKTVVNGYGDRKNMPMKKVNWQTLAVHLFR